MICEKEVLTKILGAYTYWKMLRLSGGKINPFADTRDKCWWGLVADDSAEAMKMCRLGRLWCGWEVTKKTPKNSAWTNQRQRHVPRAARRATTEVCSCSAWMGEIGTAGISQTMPTGSYEWVCVTSERCRINGNLLQSFLYHFLYSKEIFKPDFYFLHPL